ncbi:MAG: DMT family transporter [Steroidobacteraceae bacterium]
MPTAKPKDLLLLAAQHRSLAFALALVTAILWGILPLALRVLLPAMDTFTITWYRFGSSAIVVGAFLAHRSSLPNPLRLGTLLRALLVVAVIGLTINYTLFVVGVRLTTPAIAQTVTQLSSIFLLFGGLLIYHEKFSPLQWLGLALLLGGLLLFFNRRLPEILSSHSHLGAGVLVLTAGSLAWACYGLAQKRLLREYTSAQILWLLYVGGFVLLLPLVHPASLLSLDAAQGWALAFCCFNTLIAYGAYARAMSLGEVTRVSATVTTSPLFALLGSALAAVWLPEFAAAESPNLLTIVGACGVVAGSAVCALARSRA